MPNIFKESSYDLLDEYKSLKIDDFVESFDLLNVENLIDSLQERLYPLVYQLYEKFKFKLSLNVELIKV